MAELWARVNATVVKILQISQANIYYRLFLSIIVRRDAKLPISKRRQLWVIMNGKAVGQISAWQDGPYNLQTLGQGFLETLAFDPLPCCRYDLHTEAQQQAPCASEGFCWDASFALSLSEFSRPE